MSVYSVCLELRVYSHPNASSDEPTTLLLRSGLSLVVNEGYSESWERPPLSRRAPQPLVVATTTLILRFVAAAPSTLFLFFFLYPQKMSNFVFYPSFHSKSTSCAIIREKIFCNFYNNLNKVFFKYIYASLIDPHIYGLRLSSAVNEKIYIYWRETMCEQIGSWDLRALARAKGVESRMSFTYIYFFFFTSKTLKRYYI